MTLSKIWSAIVSFSEEGGKWDSFMVGEHAQAHATVAELVGSTPDIVNIEHYAQEVAESSTRRQLRRLNTVASSMIAGGNSPQEIVDEVQAQLYRIKIGNDRDRTIRAGELVGRVADDAIAAARTDTKVTGICTGFQQIDDRLFIERGQFILLAARPSVGKTALALRIAAQAAAEHWNVMFFSLEMSRRQLGQRLLAAEAGIGLDKIMRCWLDDNDQRALRAAAARVADLQYQLYIDDSSRLTTLELQAKARRMKAQYSLDLVIVDYLQLLQGPGSSLYERVTNISRELKAATKSLDCPMLVLCQLSREGTDRPELHHLRDSGALEQDADVVLFLNRQDKNDREQLEFRAAKVRQGACFNLPVRFRGETGTFEFSEWRI